MVIKYISFFCFLRLCKFDVNHRRLLVVVVVIVVVVVVVVIVVIVAVRGRHVGRGQFQPFSEYWQFIDGETMVRLKRLRMNGKKAFR